MHAFAVIKPAVEVRVQRLAERGHSEDDAGCLRLSCRLT
jgi:hypothetical protein